MDHGKATLTKALVTDAGIDTSPTSHDTPGGPDDDDDSKTLPNRFSSEFMYWESARPEPAKGAVDTKDKKAVVDAAHVHDEAFLVHLMTSPGNVDFSPDATAALRLIDGAVVVVECIDGVGLQTKTLLRHAVTERVKPVLMLNKVDRVMLELRTPPEDVYTMFTRCIADINAVIAAAEDGALGDTTVRPETGMVAFGSALLGWGFTVNTFAKMYAKKFMMSRDKMAARLWGDNFFSKAEKKWRRTPHGDKVSRGFVAFILDPVIQLTDAIMNGDVDKVAKMLRAIGVMLNADEKGLTGKPLLKCVMRKWLPVTDTVLEMVAVHLPSPRDAQQYRTTFLYDGPADDECAAAMRTCDPDGPVMMYVSRMVPTADRSRFYAFGRVFSGRIAAGQRVRIMGPEYAPGQSTALWVKNIQRTVIIAGHHAGQVADVPAGNVCGVVGVDQYLVKSGTISTCDAAHTIRQMKVCAPRVVRVAVEVKVPGDLPKLVEALKRLSKVDPLVQTLQEDTGGHVVAGVSELHVARCVRSLQEDFMVGAAVTASDPVVSYRETVRSKSSRTCMSKSANKHHRVYMEAEPMAPELQREIDDGKVTPARVHTTEQAEYLAIKYGFDAAEVGRSRLWAFGPDGAGPNFLINSTRDVADVDEAKAPVVHGFQWSTREGPLCGEPVRGVVFRVLDLVLWTPSMRRGPGQIFSTARRVVHGSMYAADPTLMEPMYTVDIAVPEDAAGAVFSTLAPRRGTVLEDVPRPGTSITVIRAHLPVAESFGFIEELRARSDGKAFANCVFDHWATMAGDPLSKGNPVHDVVVATRTRVGLPPDVPPEDAYLELL